MNTGGYPATSLLPLNLETAKQIQQKEMQEWGQFIFFRSLYKFPGRQRCLPLPSVNGKAQLHCTEGPGPEIPPLW